MPVMLLLLLFPALGEPPERPYLLHPGTHISFIASKRA